MIKVCQISTAHPTFDDRIFYKECVSLSKAGWDVYLVINAECDKQVNGVKIIALTKHQSRIKRFLFGGFSALRKALSTKSKIYHFHDPELIFVGLMLKILGKKVIYDAHEDVSKQILYKQWIGNKLIRHIISKAFYYFEQFAVFCFDSVVTATEDIGSKFNTKKNVTICNFSILGLIDSVKPIDYTSNKKVMVYAGGLTYVRGIKEIINATNYVNEVELWLIGEWGSDEYKKECMDLAGWKNVKYWGKMNMEEVYAYLHKSDLGLALLYPAKNYLTSLPVKAFEYMACGLPIIMSDFPFWKDLFKDCAMFVNPMDSKEIADVITELLNNPHQMELLKSNGRRLAETKFSWESESEKLINLYKKIAGAN